MVLSKHTAYIKHEVPVDSEGPISTPSSNRNRNTHIKSDGLTFW